jgi:hypothetical protein
LGGVSTEFQKNSGLPKSCFGPQQLSAGIVINGFLRLSAQRYFGPEQAYVNNSNQTVTVNNFKNWQFGVQITPANVKNTNKPQ